MTGNTNGATPANASLAAEQTLNLYRNEEKQYKGGVILCRVANEKLAELDGRGFEICGLAIQRTNDDGTVTRGAVTNGGMVLWWPAGQTPRPAQQEPVAKLHDDGINGDA